VFDVGFSEPEKVLHWLVVIELREALAATLYNEPRPP
jgi:hypothetical protein